MSTEQKESLVALFDKDSGAGDVDFVAGWYKKASEFIKGSKIRCAFVSTNSISQGQQPAIIWKPMLEDGIKIDFAWRTFKWDSESSKKAAVHCVIIGFSTNEVFTNKKLYLGDGAFTEAQNINAYLVDAPNVLVESRRKPLCDIPMIAMGNQPLDDGNYLFTEEAREEFLAKEPKAAPYFHKWLDAKGFINNLKKYCLWLGVCPPETLKNMPHCKKLVQAVREFRLASKRKSTLKLADAPTRFQTENMPKGTFIVIPQVSSENRRYVPMGFLTPDWFCSDKLRLMPDATLYHFGILTSNVHMAWMRAVTGRLKSDYSYSVNIVYNNFPWPTPTDAQKQSIEQAAQAILDARAKFPDASLADLYDETTMPPDLRKAHQANDRAVMAAYGFDTKISEAECVAKLMEMYQDLVKNLQ